MLNTVQQHSKNVHKPAKSFEKISYCQPLARAKGTYRTGVVRSQHLQDEPTKSFPVNTRRIPS